MARPRLTGAGHRRRAGAGGRPQAPDRVAPPSTARGAAPRPGRAAASLACMSTPSGTSVSSTSRADIGVIGGSGFYEFLEDAERVRVTTPFGDPSDDVVVGEVEGRRVAFLARHGQGHRFPPHRVNYRANLWALRVGGGPAGARAVRGGLAGARARARHRRGARPGGRPHLGPRAHRVRRGAVRSCTPASPTPTARAAGPRSLDAVERGRVARGRPAPSSSSTGRASPPRRVALAPAGRLDGGGDDRHARGVDRPRAGDVLHHVALVTDHDAGVEGGEAVSHAEVLRVFADNISGLKQILRAAIGALPPAEDDDAATCACRRALDGLPLPCALPT